MASDDTGQQTFDNVVLPVSGRSMPNRLVKVAMYEHLAVFGGGPPNQYHLGMYKRWKGYGMVITGNIQVKSNALTFARDMTIPNSINPEDVAQFTKLAHVIHSVGNELAITQLSHAGRQSLFLLGGRGFNEAPIAPSALRVQPRKEEGLLAKLVYGALFQTPRSMNKADIQDITQAFVRGATLAHKAGFDGCQIHVAHGYLLASFLSPKANLRTDEYSRGNSTHKGLLLLYEIVEAIRAALPKTFVIGVKMNCAGYLDKDSDYKDQASLPEQEERALADIKHIASWYAIDFIEVSGGDYSDPTFMTSSRESPRQAFFSKFSRVAKSALDARDPAHPVPLILLTGGMGDPKVIESALSQRHTDLVGIGRASVLVPDLPLRLKADKRLDPNELKPPDLSFASWLPRFPTLIGAGAETSWYTVRMRTLAASDEPVDSSRIGPGYAIVAMWAWFDPKTLDNMRNYLFLSVIILSGPLIGVYAFCSVLSKNL